jgi:hypothetical protein
MLAAAVTVWILFSFWLIAPLLRLPRGLGRVAGALLIAARTDLPILAGAFLALAAVRVARHARIGAP